MELTTDYENTKYLLFCDESPPSRKTKFISIYAVSTGEALGSISWFGRWRQYAFYPISGTIWTPGCLDDVNAYIRKLMAARKDVN